MKLVEITFKKVFFMRDDQDPMMIVRFWETQMGLIYVGTKEISNEAEPGLTTADIVRYTRTGETTPQLEEKLGVVPTYPRMFGGAESQDQPDGFGTNS